LNNDRKMRAQQGHEEGRQTARRFLKGPAPQKGWRFFDVVSPHVWRPLCPTLGIITKLEPRR